MPGVRAGREATGQMGRDPEATARFEVQREDGVYVA
jgi:hypothetical protein